MRFFQSIRWRLQIWHGALLCVVLAGFGVTAHQLQWGNELRRVDQELQPRLRVVMESGRRPPGGPPGFGPGEPPPQRGFRPGAVRTELFEGENSSFYYVVWSRDGRELARSASAPAGLTRPDRPDGPRTGDGRVARGNPRARLRGTFRELVDFSPPGECLLVGRSIDPELSNLRQQALVLLALGAGVLVVGLVGGAFLSARAIRSIDDMSLAATRIASGDLSSRISAAGADHELGRLVAVLNSTFARLEAAFTHQARFTSDASHELRTPVTVILSQTQSVLSRERPAEDYRQALLACQRAAQRMRRLIDSLLELARLDAGQEPLRTGPMDLGRAAADAIELLRPLAQERGIKVGQELPAVLCLGDSDRVGQVITNLVTNAIIHNRPAGEVRVETRREGDLAVLEVSDTGPGIPPEAMPDLFKRFHRVDASRTGASGGNGLGLAISKALAEAQAGTLSVENRPGGGCVFRLRLPGATGPVPQADTAVPGDRTSG